MRKLKEKTFKIMVVLSDVSYELSLISTKSDDWILIHRVFPIRLLDCVSDIQLAIFYYIYINILIILFYFITILYNDDLFINFNIISFCTVQHKDIKLII